jgi:hypothetical protein
MNKAAIEPHPGNPNFPKTYDAPKSICTCGHTGDGPDSQHDASEFGVKGHGPCHVEGCTECVQFSWAAWTPDYAVVLDVLRARQRR